MKILVVDAQCIGFGFCVSLKMASISVLNKIVFLWWF
ncbi:hypothetical protein Arcve_0653 [Archaeoglobus veneficus SNP6]|uniref:Uncharacterized protein n=1 Tax=Archaeoglobus veneficus (strain DSM 11195 / SNP6) TaxID=693661 RepID=F2KR36_ARCVS|nr:hypothetical protein Arcve_0653 [Archaeoglobus veneficus SNP6]